jgi:hypothetical protein
MQHRLVIISPDKNTDYCYLDMSNEAAIERFKQCEDWLNLYQPRGYVPKADALEFGDSFMLWRNQANDMADHMEERGVPPELVNLFRRPE